MKERPILFSGEMVRAILDGRKTQTRRVIKCTGKHKGETPAPASGRLVVHDGAAWDADCLNFNLDNHSTFCEPLAKCPYGQPGDRLWVREAWNEKAWTDDDCRKMGCPDAPTHPSEIYLGVPLRAIHRASCATAYGDAGPWRPSIHMPRWASRITLEITDVRVELVQEIGEADAIAEGAQCPGFPASLSNQGAFAKLWDSINAKRGYGWSANPWVWVVEFKRIGGAS